MSKDQAVGAVILLGSIVGLLIYLYLVWTPVYSLVMLQLTASIAVGAVLLILAWIGYTLATTPPPPSVEEIEKELEEELKEIEKEEEGKKEEEEKEEEGEEEKKEEEKQG
ncbi:MAG: transcriptional regulator [Thermoproteales archaeon]|nr:transcriptional regulator [Thermoproteales archaeon]